MRLLTLFCVLLCLWQIPVAAGQSAQKSKKVNTQKPLADLVFVNGNIYTVNEKQPKAEAVAIKNGTILFVGSTRQAQNFIGKETKTIDLHGQTVVPGLTDAHCHLMGIGLRELQLNLEGTQSLDDFLNRVKERVAQSKKGEWVTGRGWIETFWQPPVFPTRQDLDRIAPDNPVFLNRADGHGAVANSLALKIAGISKDTPNPTGGEIMRDKTTGEPSGMLLDNANDLMEPHLPKITAVLAAKALQVGVERSLSLGWSTLHIAGNSLEEIALIKQLYAMGKIKIRLYNAVSGPGPAADKLLKDGPEIDLFDGRYTIRGIKLYMDGALGSKGAALLEKYSDYDTAGFLINKEEDLLPIMIAALKKGVQIETHAIGDRGNRTTLDWYQKAFDAVPNSTPKPAAARWRVEHAQIINPADIPRFAKMGVIPSMQPSHAIGDLFFAPSRLGMKRLEGAYAWKSLINAGSTIAGGTDAPVERGEPMIEFYAAVARKDQKGFSGEGWHPEQAVSREQALKMFTLWAAYAAFEEQKKGSLEPGKYADLTVLSADIMKIPEAEILKTRCTMTVVGGEVVYQSK
ncbi:MAG: amidohydrolase [Blastocatellia bacterium]|nr:amidohydrolase [Blastocatellia bacterium]